jgi:hypothetical protein
MSRTRDIIQEIADIRQRKRFGPAMAELPFRLFALETAFKEHDKSKVELTRYFPVALIACVEGYFRIAIKDLIDSGEPFLTNAEKPASSIKLDFTVLRAVHGKAITVGELVAHGVSLSRLEHIENVLSNLLGFGFLQTLRSTTDRWAHEVRGEPPKPILSNPDEVFANVARTFELRHIICHEIASAYEIDTDEVGRCFESCVSFFTFGGRTAIRNPASWSTTDADGHEHRGRRIPCGKEGNISNRRCRIEVSTPTTRTGRI